MLILSIFGALTYQLLSVYPQISKSHPYSDSLIYQDLAEGNLNFYGPTHITHRIVLPGLVQVVFSQISIPSQWIFAIFQSLLLALVLWRVYKVTDGLKWAFFVFLMLSLPSFWRGFFLPMSDAFLWGFLTLFWLEADKKYSNPLALFILFSVALFSKEMAIFGLLFVIMSPLKNKKTAILATFLPIITWFFLESFYANNGSNYLFEPNLWLNDIQKNISLNILWAPKYILSGFSGFLLVYAYRWFITGKKYFYQIAPELILMVIILLIAPENSPRILFPFTGIMALRLAKQY